MHGRKIASKPQGGAPVSNPAGNSHLLKGPGPSPALPFPEFMTTQADGVLLRIKLQPRASRNEIGEPLGSELRVKVTAPPVDSAANEALIRLIAETLDWPRSKVELVSGHASRHKTVKVYGAVPSAILTKLA